MKKYIAFILLILFSCQREEIIVPDIHSDIFNIDIIEVHDGQEITFETSISEEHTLLIIDSENNSVLTKETFTPKEIVNTRNIYTKALPKQKLRLVLLKGSEEIKSTFILVE